LRAAAADGALGRLLHQGRGAEVRLADVQIDHGRAAGAGLAGHFLRVLGHFHDVKGSMRWARRESSMTDMDDVILSINQRSGAAWCRWMPRCSSLAPIKKLQPASRCTIAPAALLQYLH
jgi:hypothetical protein